MNLQANFEEKQIFEGYSFIVPIAIISLLPATVLISTKNLFAGLGIGIGIFTVVMLTLNFIKLFLRIDNTGISYKFRPFHWSFNKIQWSEITKISIIELKSLRDFGGFGIRWSGKKKGIILAGKSALEIKDNKGKVIVISLKNEKEAQKTIDFYQKNNKNY